MCGIFGYLDTEFDSSIYDLNLNRGSSSFGFYDIDNNIVVKHFGVDITETDSLYLSKSKNILCHLRAPTTANDLNNQNNHPFETDRFVLAHNGILFDWYGLRMYSKDYSISTDSYIIVSLIQFYSEQGKHTSIAIEEAISHIKGSFACWLFDKQTKDVYLFRCINPLFINKECTIFSSEEFEDSISLNEGVIYRISNKKLEILNNFHYYNPYSI